MPISNMRPHSQRFCDVALTVKFYCDCDVAKSLRMGPSADSDCGAECPLGDPRGQLKTGPTREEAAQ